MRYLQTIVGLIASVLMFTEGNGNAAFWALMYGIANLPEDEPVAYLNQKGGR